MSPDYGLQFIYNINLIVSVLFCTIAIYFSFEKEPNIIVMTVFSALPAAPALYCYYKIKRMPLLDDDYIQDQITAGRKLFLDKTDGEILEEIKILNGSTFHSCQKKSAFRFWTTSEAATRDLLISFTSRRQVSLTMM